MWGLCGCHGRQQRDLLSGENGNLVQTDFFNLDQNFKESDARGILSAYLNIVEFRAKLSS